MVMGIIDEKLVPVSVKQLATLGADNRNLSPFIFAFFAAEFEGAYRAAHGTFVQIFPDSMPGGEPFLFQYLKNSLSRDIDLMAYL